MNLKKSLITLALGFCFISASAQKQFEINLWDNKPLEVSSDANDIAMLYAYLPDEKKLAVVPLLYALVVDMVD